MARIVKIDVTVLDAFMEDEGHPGDEIMQTLENIIEDMKADKGNGGSETMTITVTNDFEADEEESEDEESEATDETEPSKEA